MRLRAMFLLLRKPETFNIDGNNVVSRRCDLFIEDKGAICIRLQQEAYEKLLAKGFKKGDEIEIEFDQRITKGELRIQPVDLHRVAKAG